MHPRTAPSIFWMASSPGPSQWQEAAQHMRKKRVSSIESFWHKVNTLLVDCGNSLWREVIGTYSQVVPVALQGVRLLLEQVHKLRYQLPLWIIGCINVEAYNTRSGYDPPSIVWIHLTVHPKFVVSLTFCSGVRSNIQTQLCLENIMYYRMPLPMLLWSSPI